LENKMNVGDKVTKKSGKPFQNGSKFAFIESFATMEIPLGNKQIGTQVVEAVTLRECKGLVTKDILIGENNG